MFAVHSVYLKPIGEVDKFLEAHRAFLKSFYEKGDIICSGPQVPRIGGFILMNAPNKEAVMEFIKQDPYTINGVAAYSVIEFQARSFADGFKSFVE